MTVVLDTNVILSAIFLGGKPRQILGAALGGSMRLFVSEPIIAELQRVMQRPKFGISAQFVQTVVSELTAVAEWVEPTKHLEVVDDDPTDNQFIDCAVAANVDYLVTGDSHLLKLGQYGNTRIVNADAFITILSKGKSE
jgi:putative PIN family toxin of toxin-antitoxin system